MSHFHALECTDLPAFWQNPAWQDIPATTRAALIGQVHLRHLAAGETLMERGHAGEMVHLIRQGDFLVQRPGHQHSTNRGFLGAERALGHPGYTATVIARNAATVYVIAASALHSLAQQHGPLNHALLAACMDAESPAAPVPSSGDAPDQQGILGWLGAIVLPLAVWLVCHANNLPSQASYFLAIISCTAVMWIAQLAPAFVPALFTLLAVIVFDVVAADVATAGFASSSFFMLLSIFAVGTLMSQSGLSYRVSLWLLARLPAHSGWHTHGLLLFGLLLTPVIPSQLARSSLIAPFLHTLSRLYHTEHTPGQHILHLNGRLFASTIAGISLAASIFLTGKPANLLAFGLFGPQTQYAFEWLRWLLAASFCGGLLLLFHLGAQALVFRQPAITQIGGDKLNIQLATLGPMRGLEWGALLAILLITLGMLTASWHKIELPWLSLTVLIILLLFGALHGEQINRFIDWSVLIFIAAIVTWPPIMTSTGISDMITTTFASVGGLMKRNLPGFIAGLSLGIVLLRLVLPELVAEILLLTLLLPLAHAHGVSEWLIGFVILTLCEGYFFPYQAPYHGMLHSRLHQDGFQFNFSGRAQLKYNALMMLGRVIAVFLAFPFWTALDII